MQFDPVARIQYWQILRPYVAAAIAVVVALLARMELDPWLQDRQPFMTFMAAVIFAAWIGGVGPALMTLVAGLVLAAWFFLAPRHDLLVVGTVQYIAMATYFTLGLTIVALGGKLWRTKRLAERNEELYGTQSRELESERKRLQRELTRLGEELRDVDRRRENFLALLADELRRPLVPIASAASFHGIAATASEMESAMDIVKQEMTQLGHLIDDLLDAFQNSQGAIALHRQRLDLVEIVGRAVTGLRSHAAQTGRELNITLSNEPLVVDGDPARLVRVTYTLVMNAIRSTSPGGQIWISALARDGEALLKVKDTGVGMSADAIERIFQLNSQLDQHLPRQRGGLGISLLAVKPIVEMHGAV